MASLSRDWLYKLPLNGIQGVKQLGGGSINQAYRVDTAKGPYMLKVQQHQQATFFEHEIHGLRDLGTVINAPQPLAHGQINGSAYLIMTWINQGEGSQKDLGKAVAKMHKKHAHQFGFATNHRTTVMLKNNSWNDSWVDFYVNQRINPEVEVAKEHGCWNDDRQAHFERMRDAFVKYYSKHSVAPSLLHGDLWFGNVMFDVDGRPTLIDPDAVYGDREFDLAMTTVFGGFSQDFYDGYQEEYPLEPGVNDRLDWYRFYYLCMHLILFGGGYGRSVDEILSHY